MRSPGDLHYPAAVLSNRQLGQFPKVRSQPGTGRMSMAPLCLCAAVGAAVLGFLVGGFGYLVSYYTGSDTYHECRVAMAQEQYRSGHHGEYCYQMWISGRWDIDTPDDRDIGP